LAAKVRCVADERCDEIFPHQFPAVLRVELVDGSRHEVRVDTNRGGPERPLSTDELATKVRLNASRVLDADAAAAVARAGLALPGAPDVSGLMDLVRGGDDA
jgi:2-methylcitrate dehydratase PrpD